MLITARDEPRQSLELGMFLVEVEEREVRDNTVKEQVKSSACNAEILYWSGG